MDIKFNSVTELVALNCIIAFMLIPIMTCISSAAYNNPNEATWKKFFKYTVTAGLFALFPFTLYESYILWT